MAATGLLQSTPRRERPDGTLTAKVFHTDMPEDEGYSGIWDYRFWEEDIIE